MLPYRVSISFIYGLAKRHYIPNDPILWFAMMIMPVGPPAILLSSLSELEGNERTKLEMAKMLFVGTPFFLKTYFFLLVGGFADFVDVAVDLVFGLTSDLFCDCGCDEGV